MSVPAMADLVDSTCVSLSESQTDVLLFFVQLRHCRVCTALCLCSDVRIRTNNRTTQHNMKVDLALTLI